ncbi:MAG: CRISPR-associated endonuclease Cas3'' [Deltaproteobacteria bacterium]|jgi:3'-5' exoribonuclease|nr:CRISPR-associated endonuclease Cas3'' [Deltaproteobacteria bacterium]
MLILKNIFVKDLSEGTKCIIPLLVQKSSLLSTRSNFPYLALELKDNTGVVIGRVWENVERIEKKIQANKVAVFEGDVTTYGGKLQIIIRSVLPLKEDEYVLSDYLKPGPPLPQGMQAELWELVNSIKDPDYRSLTERVLNEPRAQAFWTSPAAKVIHHSYSQGLLEHTLSVAKIANFVEQIYAPRLNRSLLLAGAILHDIGKVFEFFQELPTDYTTTGRLLGHPVLGTLFVTEVAGTFPNFPKAKLLLLQHLLISHHGEREKGSPEPPRLLEAIVLHHSDYLDGSTNAIATFLQDQNTSEDFDFSKIEGSWTDYHKFLSGKFMRTPIFPEMVLPEPVLPPPQDHPYEIKPADPEAPEPKVSDPDNPVTLAPLSPENPGSWEGSLSPEESTKLNEPKINSPVESAATNHPLPSVQELENDFTLIEQTILNEGGGEAGPQDLAESPSQGPEKSPSRAKEESLNLSFEVDPTLIPQSSEPVREDTAEETAEVTAEVTAGVTAGVTAEPVATAAEPQRKESQAEGFQEEKPINTAADSAEFDRGLGNTSPSRGQLDFSFTVSSEHLSSPEPETEPKTDKTTPETNLPEKEQKSSKKGVHKSPDSPDKTGGNSPNTGGGLFS